MKFLSRQIFIYGSLVLALSACGGDSNKSGPDIVDADDFVKDQFALTSDRTDPVDINPIIFRFDEREDSNVFDSLLN